MEYVIEFGFNRKDAATGLTEWVSKGFYNLYGPNGGPVQVVPDRQHAFRFERHEMAENVMGGDERIKNNARIVPFT